MSDGLKNKTLYAFFWNFLESFGQQGIQFVISIILTRLLFSEEFSLISMLTICMAIAQSFINSSFGQTFITDKNTVLNLQTKIIEKVYIKQWIKYF